MNIEILANHGEVGGGEVMLMLIAEAAAGLGHRVTIVGPAESELEHIATTRGLDHHGLRAGSRRDLLLAYERHGRTSNADLLWCNGPIPALATTTSSRRRITHLHQVPSTMQAMLLRPSRRRSTRTLVPSVSMAAAIPGSQSFTNWTAAPPPAAALRSSRPTESSGFRVGFIGRTSTDKGLHLLADAIASLPGDLGITLVVAGDARFVDSEHLAPVEAAIDRLGDAVDPIGWVDRDEFFSRVDVVVVPSIWAEPFGLVAAEAMARRVPLVVTSSGALPEIVGPEHPWIVGAGDPTAIASTLLGMTADPAKVERSVEAAAQRWRAMFSPDAGAARTLALLESIGDS